MDLEVIAVNSHYRYTTLEYFAKTVSEIGFKKIELWTGPHHFFVDYITNDDIDDLLYLMNKYNLEIYSICPEQTNPKIGNIATTTGTRQKRMLDYFKRQIDLASEVNAKYVVVTAGWGFLDEKKEDALKRSIDSMRILSEYALEKNISLVLEALQPDESNIIHTANDINNYVKEVNSEGLRVCLDFGAMARSNDTIEKYFDLLANKIEHVHFVDGNPTGHLALGDGERDLKKDLYNLIANNYTGTLALETANSRYFFNPKQADLKSYHTYKKIWEEINI